MKKYLLSLLAVATVVGCTTFEDEQSDAVVNPTSPAITVSGVEDTGFAATIAAQAGTGFYSYAVLPGAPQDLNPTTLLKVGYKNAVAAGTVDYAKSPSKTIELTELARNTVYTVYAVAASQQGTVGEVVSQKVTTSDAEIPAPKSATYEDYTMTVTFSEPIKYTGKKATVNYYAVNTPSGAEYNIKENKPVGSVKATVTADGNVATFKFDEPIPNGAYFAVSYPAGAFEDAVGNPVNAMESGFGTDKDGKLASKGITGRQDTVNFDLTLYSAEGEEAELESVSDLMSPIWIAVPEDYIHFKATVPATSKDIEGYSIVYEGAGESHTYTTPGPYDYGWNGTYNCALAYPNAMSGRPDPIPGQYLTITIPEGFLIDIWGNTNNVFVIGPVIYSYGYTLEDVIGTYNVEAEGYFDGPTTFTIVIEESDDEEKGNIMFTTMYGDPVDEGLNLYADFNLDGGTITIADWQPLWAIGDGYWKFAVNGADEVVLSVPEPGVIKDTGTWFGYYADVSEGAGWGEVFKTFNATRVEEEGAGVIVAPASVSFRKNLAVKSTEKVIR